MKPVVLDCSVALSWCFSDEANAFSDDVLTYLRKNGALVPPLWSLEVTNGLLTAEKRKRISLDGVLKFIEMFARLPIRVMSLSSNETFSGIFKIAYDCRLTTYDATYLYLAMRERSPLATLDKALREARKRYSLPEL